ncbi:MAG: dockerin type I domain-containing protein, partial [Gammaproteobacteria bacterium]
DGQVTAADGIMLARYLLGVRGPALVDGQSNANANKVAKNIQAGIPNLKLDVNADKKVDGKDGLIIARFLLGLRGDALLKGLEGDDEEVQKKIQGLRGGE